MNETGCPDGQATDHWFLLRAENERGEYECDVPLAAFKALSSLYIIFQASLFPVFYVAYSRAVVKAAKFQFIILTLHGLVGIGLVLAVLLDSDFARADNKPAIWIVYTINLMLFVISTTASSTGIYDLASNLIKHFPSDNISNFNRKMDGKLLVKVTWGLYAFCFGIIVISWCVLVNISEPAETSDWRYGKGDEKLVEIDEFWFRIGCLNVAVIFSCLCFFLYLKLTILKQYVDSMTADNPSQDEIFMKLKYKVKRIRQHMYAPGFGAVATWLVQGFVLRFTWYMVLFHQFNSCVYQCLIVYLYLLPKQNSSSRSGSKNSKFNSKSSSRTETDIDNRNNSKIMAGSMVDSL